MHAARRRRSAVCAFENFTHRIAHLLSLIDHGFGFIRSQDRIDLCDRICHCKRPAVELRNDGLHFCAMIGTERIVTRRLGIGAHLNELRLLIRREVWHELGRSSDRNRERGQYKGKKNISHGIDATGDR